MARRTKEEAAKTRAQIMDSALSLFVRKGYDRTTFNDIAARLKLTKGAVYWHFECKESLLVAILDDMFRSFERQFTSLRVAQGGGVDVADLSFGFVADLMVKNARMVVSSRRLSSFFMLMKCQMRWRDVSMSKVRENLISNERFGPLQAFRCAIENDVSAGRARRGVDALQMATVCIAIWDGLVQGRIDRFLACDLEDTLRKSYRAVWDSIRT